MATTSPEPSSPPSSASPAAASGAKKRKAAHDEIEVDLKLPEPPSKKAKRALKKGKPVRAKPQSGDEQSDAGSDGDKKGGGGSSSKKKARSPYGVWVGNLPFTTTKAELRAWLIANAGGAITADAITRVHMPVTKKPVAEDKDAKSRGKGKKKVGKKGEEGEGGEGAAEDEKEKEKEKEKTVTENKGFAYVDFATFEANVAAIALSESEIAGSRKLLIKDSKSFEGRPKAKDGEDGETAAGDGASKDKDKGKAQKDRRTKVFVGNLSFQTTEDILWEHFARCGAIRWIKVATFEDTGKCKGYAWVNFEDAEAAAWAVKGFVKIKETVDTIEDFMDQPPTAAAAAATEGDAQDGDGEDGAQSVRRTKTRKWWVNKLQGRELKVELAEDEQVRQKKRFGKGGDGKRPRRDTKEEGQQQNEGEDGQRQERATDARRPKPKTDLVEARLMGLAVQPQGKRVTFD